MDPTTTLMTFMLQTSSHARSVQLIGSWDNFSRRYPMEKDARRGHREWRGCYSFKDIICDGDSVSPAKRNGGLKMGHTYYYYYEIDDGIEIHDPTRPFTTACQYLPGQPVNFVWVPVEESPLRERSASVGATGTDDIKTMNPADKYLTPRAPPPTPRSLPRLNTSPSVVAKKRGARSTSPVPRSPWSARVLFGLKSPVSAAPNNDRRLSPSRSHEGDAHISYPTLVSSTNKRATALAGKTGSGETSPSTRNPAPRDAAPANPSIHPNKNSVSSPFISLPHDSFEDEFEDDDNFASTSQPPIDDDERSSITSLSPPPPKRDFLTLQHLTLGPTESKPLPHLPSDASPSMVPSPLHVLPQPLSFDERMNPKSHFSIDSIATSFASLAGSQFDSSSPSAYDSTDEYVVTDDGFDFGFSTPKPPVVLGGAERDAQAGSFYGYSLPLGEADGGMEKHNRSDSLATVTLEEGGARSSFGSPVFQTNSPASPDNRTVTALDELLDELGYLGDFISGD